MDVLRTLARISKLDTKTNVYIGEKMNAQGTILDETDRNKSCVMVMWREWIQRFYKQM
jgi:hypothetical protein